MLINIKFSKFFSHIQETPWYRQFLNPIIDEIDNKSKLLDVGTGTGKLLQILSNEKEVNCFGIDTDPLMLEEAKKKLNKTNTQLQKIEANKRFPFDNSSFDFITICNVLFNLKEIERNHILTESLRVLKKKGKIVVLTPTGKGNIFTLTKKYFSLKNLSIYIWYGATRKRAGPWTKNKYLQKFSMQNLKYKHKIILNGFAQVEILERV